MGKVIVYSTTTCPYCVMVKDWLKGKNVEYEDFNVGTDQEKAKEMMDKSGQMGVPVIDIEGEVIIGFDKPKLEAALEKAGK
ncbi:MAG: NrdH-redoxin [Candidatus Diapherotrites archaeon]|jgi:glutaredoxin 3|uniref:NrdH-redoxin n=1 Tax=Candidatus Iainarchaeum sp. TaxID=3101447 RepID=A0A8T5GF07_9ARCH|nr:NrdH-redoxin [Candidatus Diapherotrites archaeon]MBT7241296.1 NrdH-redoxin [Candidatus Diapherotrites archaeon]